VLSFFYNGDSLVTYVDRFEKTAPSNVKTLADLRNDAEYQQRNKATAEKHLNAMKKKLKASK
jgi:hypothetical protein